MNKTTRVVMYCRVATDDQLALDAQTDSLKIYANERNMDIADVYRDIGPTGKEQDSLQHLLRDAEHQAFEKVLVLKPSRLARDTTALLDITARLQRVGVTIEYADGSSPTLELMEKVRG